MADVARGNMYMRPGGLWDWADREERRLHAECRETLDRIARIDRQLLPRVVALAERAEPLWTAVVEALAMSCFNTARALGGDADNCVWVSAPLLWRYKPFRRLRDVLERALDGAHLGLGGTRPASSAPTGSVGRPRGLRATELLVDIETAVHEAGITPLDMGMLVASLVGIAGLDLSRPHVKVRMHNWEIARATGLTDGDVRRRLAHGRIKLTEALVVRGLLDSPSGEKHGNSGRVESHRRARGML